MSIQRLLGIVALLLFIVFVASFFAVLVRLSWIGVTTERYAEIVQDEAVGEGPVLTRFDLYGLNPETGRLRFNISSRIDCRSAPFDKLADGRDILLRIENVVPELKRNTDLIAAYREPPSGESYVNLDFGEFEMDIFDRRDFYPFDGYELSFNFAYFISGDTQDYTGSWYQPNRVIIRSFTNMILLNPRYGVTSMGDSGFRTRVARLRILQYLTATLLLIEILFMVYLLTLVNLQELMAKGLGYLIGLYIVRNILVTNAPQFPTIIDYSTIFLICVVFFIMLFKFLGGAEERALITLPVAWRNAMTAGRESGGNESDNEKKELGKNEESDDEDIRDQLD